MGSPPGCRRSVSPSALPQLPLKSRLGFCPTCSARSWWPSSRLLAVRALRSGCSNGNYGEIRLSESQAGADERANPGAVHLVANNASLGIKPLDLCIDACGLPAELDAARQLKRNAEARVEV